MQLRVREILRQGHLGEVAIDRVTQQVYAVVRDRGRFHLLGIEGPGLTSGQIVLIDDSRMMELVSSDLWRKKYPFTFQLVDRLR